MFRMNERVELAKIPAVTFYKHARTSTLRTGQLPQMICVGETCNLYTPDAVHCVNIGGTGTNIDWKVSCGHSVIRLIELGLYYISAKLISLNH